MSTLTPMPIAGSVLAEHRHVCAFFRTPEEEYRVMFPFIREAIERGERTVSLVPAARTDYLDRLRDAGVDVEAEQNRRQFELLSTDECYSFEGAIDVDGMLARVRSLFEEGRILGFSRTSLSGHGERALINPQNVDSFLEYESRLIDVINLGPDPLICVYDLDQISAGIAFEVLRTHPMTIVGGLLQSNPFFVPPDEYLKSVRRHKVTTAAREPVSEGVPLGASASSPGGGA
jgi:hypothetical protein